MSWFNDHRYRGQARAARRSRIKVLGDTLFLPLFPEDCCYAEIAVNEDWCDQRSESECAAYDKMRLSESEIVFVYDGWDEGEEVPGDSAQIDFYLAVSCKFEVCPTCEGRGSHVNPSIDDRGITSSEWAEWDEDEHKMYRSGGYDVPCYECGGLRVVETPDLEHASEAVKLHVKRLEKEEAEAAREDAEDRRTQWYEMGCPE